MTKSILIVEDEAAIAKVMAAYLRKAGYQVSMASDGLEALKRFEAETPSLVLLDIMLPGMDGLAVLKQIRSRCTCPVIMVTAKADIDDRLAGLNEGADDYLSKPFVPEEVVARVRAVLRRPVRWLEADSRRSFGSLLVDFAAQRVILNGAELALLPRDLQVFLYLAEHPNRTLTREELIEQVWGIDYDGSDRAVDLSMKRLRQSLSHWPASEGEIRTLRGTGYQLWVGE